MYMIGRLIAFSTPGILLYWSIVAHYDWLMYLLTGLNLITVFLHWGDGWSKLARELIADKRAFIVDWWPIIVVVPFCVYAASQRELWGVVGINAVFWAESILKMRELKRWKDSME